MPKCQKCSESRIVDVSAKCSDLFSASMENKDYDGYVPSNLGIGADDYVHFSYCLNCGQIQGEWPLPLTKYEKSKEISSYKLNPQIQSILDYVIATEGIRMRETFELITNLQEVTDIATTLNELIRINYLSMANYFLEQLEDWDRYNDLEKLIKYPDDDDDEESDKF